MAALTQGGRAILNRESLMSHLPKEPEAFTETVARRLGKIIGAQEVRTSGPFELTINQQVVELNNLYRHLRHKPEEAEAAIEELAEEILQAKRLSEVDLPLEAVATRVLPRICPFDYFRGRRADQMAHQLFINDTVIVYTIDLNGSACPIRTEQMIRWGLKLDKLDRMARANLAAHQPDLELTVFHTDDGSVAALDTGDGYDASRILLSRLHEQVSPELGGNFIVAIPTRDVFVAFPKDSDQFIQRIRQRVKTDYQRLPYPITDDLFLVSADGVSAWRPAA